LVSTGESSASSTAERATGLISLSSPTVIKIGHPFVLGARDRADLRGNSASGDVVEPCVTAA
jgi:hypothetical protein